MLQCVATAWCKNNSASSKAEGRLYLPDAWTFRADVEMNWMGVEQMGSTS